MIRVGTTTTTTKPSKNGGIVERVSEFAEGKFLERTSLGPLAFSDVASRNYALGPPNDDDDRDCFNRVLWGKDDSGEICFHSWLNFPCWIGRRLGVVPIGASTSVSETTKEILCMNDDKTSVNKRQPSTNEVTVSTNQFGEFHDQERTEDVREDEENMLHSRSSLSQGHKTYELLESLSLQLLKLKQRLWPAAIACSSQTRTEERPNQADKQKERRTFSPHTIFRKARSTFNPFERLGEGRKGGLNTMFVNRSAMKLVNLNAMLDFELLRPPRCFDNDNDGGGETFRFVDLCGAPGGFSEYILLYCRDNGVTARGWGMSLIGSNQDGKGVPWNLKHMHRVVALSSSSLLEDKCDSSSIFTACEGRDGTGDVCNWDNVEALRDEIHVATTERGEDPLVNGPVHLVVADGGCDAQRNRHEQEEQTLRIVVSEMAAALSLLQPGGSLVLKIFGTRHVISRKIIRWLFRRFERMTILKPVLSRPASAERYLVCVGFEGRDNDNVNGHKSATDWDGLTWKNEVLSTVAAANDGLVTETNGSRDIENCEDDDEHHDDSDAYSFLMEYLNATERDILKLNIKACFGIVSHLEKVCEGIGDVATGSSFSPKQGVVDVESYRKAWRLGRYDKYDEHQTKQMNRVQHSRNARGD